MAKTKSRMKYQGISLPVPIMQKIKKYILEHDEYRSMADFITQAIKDKMRNESFAKVEENNLRKIIREEIYNYLIKR